MNVSTSIHRHAQSCCHPSALSAHMRRVLRKLVKILGKVETPGTQRTGCGVPLIEMSPDPSYVNGFSTVLSLFDTLEIQYIIDWPIDKKIPRHEI